MRDDVGADGLDGLAVGVDPADPVSLHSVPSTACSLQSVPTCISLTVQVKVASWPTSTVMFFMSSTNRGFIPAPTADKIVFYISKMFMKKRLKRQLMDLTIVSKIFLETVKYF